MFGLISFCIIMSQLFDLNVQNYSLCELLDFFEVSSNDDGALVERKCVGLKQKIQGDPKLGPVTKRKIHDFLNKATDRLSQSRADIKNVKANASMHAPMNAPMNAPPEFMELKNKVEQYGDNLLIARPSAKFAIPNAINGGGPSVSVMLGAPPGIINPIAISTIKRALNVDTRFRNNYYSTKSTDFVFSIPFKFENVTRMSVATYEIPITFYAISKGSGNNCILFLWESSPSVSPVYDKQYTLLVPDGNYGTTISRGATENIDVVINAILAGTDLVKQTGLSITLDNASGRSIFACNSATDASGNPYPTYHGAMRIVFNVDANTDWTAASASTGESSFQNNTTPLPYFLGWQLGFRTAMYEMSMGMDASGNMDVPQAAVSEGICMIVGPNYVFLCIDDYHNNVNNYYVSTFGSSTIAPNIIARLNTQSQFHMAGPYSIMSGESLSTSLTYSREYFGPIDIQRIRITLVDDFGRVLDLNNMDWSFALMFECVYSSSSA